MTLKISLLAICVSAALLYGCKEQAQPPVTQPSESPPVTAAPVTPIPPRAAVTTSRPVEAKKPEIPWAIFRHAQEESQGWEISPLPARGKQLELQTRNVDLLTLDFNKLPEDAAKKGPWTLTIDGQGIEIYGRPGMRVLDLARSRNGDWNVVPDSHRTQP
ncbi:MAG TPA: hypothetical protein VMV81_10550 [Phycisphaerae bacterium]|nr:hypothetical protein [Phycisphaerae bacterium]